MVYECDQCSTALPPGVWGCINCGQAFDQAVPADAQWLRVSEPPQVLLAPSVPEVPSASKAWEGQRGEAASGRDLTPSLITQKNLSLDLSAEEIYLLLWLCSKAARPGTEALRAVTAMEGRLLGMQADLRGETPAEQAAKRPPNVSARPPRESLTDLELASLEEALGARQSLAGLMGPIAERVKLLFSRGGRSELMGSESRPMQLTPSDFSRQMEEMAQRALDGDQAVSLAEMLPDSFLRRHTDFASLREMLAYGGIEKSGDLEGHDWNIFVAAHSDFSGWTAMLEAAGKK